MEGAVTLGKRLLSPNGDNPISAWVDHPISKLATRALVTVAGLGIAMIVFIFTGLQAEVKATAADVFQIRNTVNDISYVQKTAARGMANTDAKVNEIERLAQLNKSRLDVIETNLFGFRPNPDSPPRPLVRP